MPTTWPDEVEEILDGDLTAALAYNLPRGGAALVVVAPIGLQDRSAGTVAFTTSLGFGRKLDRIARDPRVALAFHAREHGYAARPGFVLVQGRARVEEIGQGRQEQLRARSERYLGPMPSGRFWRWWLSAYLAERVLVTIAVDRLTVIDGHGPATVLGREPAPPPGPQSPPAAAPASSPRPHRLAGTLKRICTLPHLLVGYSGSDGYPVILPAGRVTADGQEARLTEGGLPAGGRRAALLGHRYRPMLVGLETRLAIGWLVAREGGEDARFEARRVSGFRAPASKRLLLLVNGYLSRRGVRRRATG